MQESWSHRQTRRPIAFSFIRPQRQCESKHKVSECQCCSIWYTVLWAPSHSGQLLSNWDTGWGCREPGIFSVPNMISMTWINYFTFLYSSFPLYIYLFCLLLNTWATPLKISEPLCNEIIHLLWSCRSWTMTQVSPPFATCLSQVITFSLTVLITSTKELPCSLPSSESILVGKHS